MATGRSQYLQPDPTVTASAAGDAFGGGTGNAELLIAANQLRYSEYLEAANLNKPDDEAKKALDPKDVEDAAGVTPLDYSVRGNFVVVVYEGANGRVGKLTLHYDRDSGEMERTEIEETPELAALRAQVEAASKVEDAKREAEKLIEDARQEAARITAEAEAQAAAKAAERRESEDEERSLATQNVGGAGGADGPNQKLAHPEGSGQIEDQQKRVNEGGDPYEGLSADDLRKLAEDRGLQVEGTGAKGAVKGSDALQALRDADAAAKK